MAGGYRVDRGSSRFCDHAEYQPAASCRALQLAAVLAEARPLLALESAPYLLFTHRNIATVINGAVRENNLQSANQRGALVFSPRTEQLQHREVAEAVNRDTRQTIGFAGDQTVAVQTVFFASQSRHVCACCRRRVKKSISMDSDLSNVQTRARICDAGEYAPRANHYPDGQQYRWFHRGWLYLPYVRQHRKIPTDGGAVMIFRALWLTLNVHS